MDPKPMKAMFFGAKLNLGDDQRIGTKGISKSSIFSKTANNEMSVAEKLKSEVLAYANKHSVEELGLTLDDLRPTPVEAYIEYDSSKLEPFELYVYMGPDIGTLDLRKGDCMMAVPPERYGELLPSRAIENVSTDSEILVRVTRDPFLEYYEYFTMKKETIETYPILKLNDPGEYLAENISYENTLVFFDSVPVALISGGRSVLIYQEDFAKSGYLIEISCPGNNKLKIVRKLLKEGNLHNHGEVVVDYDYEGNGYMVFKDLFDGVVI